MKNPVNNSLYSAAVQKASNANSQQEFLKERLRKAEAKDIWTASETGNIEVLRRCIKELGVLSKKKGVNTLNSEGKAPIHLAVINNQPEALDILLENKADPCCPDSENYQPLHWAAKMGLIPIATTLLSCPKVSVNGCGAFERTPLHMASFNGHEDMVRLLLTHGASINAKTNAADRNKTPLHEAAFFGRTEMVNCLLCGFNMDVMICDQTGNSPLTYAIMEGHLESAKLIKKHKTWKPTKDNKDPNHKENLLKLKIPQNEKEIKEFIGNLSQ